WDKAPITAVLAVVSIVTHHKVMGCRHDDLVGSVSFMLKDWIVVFGKIGIVKNVVALISFARRSICDFQRILTIVIDSFDPMLREDCAIDNDVSSVDANAITRQTDYALHVVSSYRLVIGTLIITPGVIMIAGIFKNYNVAASYLSLR